MNISRPVGSIQPPDRRPVRIFLISESREKIEQTISQLCTLGNFCERLEWSDIIPKPDTHEYMSIMTKNRERRIFSNFKCKVQNLELLSHSMI